MKKLYDKELIFGSAKFSKEEGVNDEIARKTITSALVIGNSTSEPDRRIIIEPERHMLSVAPTRSGKSTSLITTNLLHNKRSSVVCDPKGELTFLTARARHAMGQKIFIFDPFDEYKKNYGDITGEVEELTSFNPLATLKPGNCKDTIRYIAESLIFSMGVSDSHWTESALELIEGILAWLIEDPTKEPSLPELRRVLTLPLDELSTFANEAQDPNQDSIAKRKLGRFSSPKLHENKELVSIISTAITQTAFLDDPELTQCLSSTTQDFSFECLTEEEPGATIYLILPFDKLQTHSRWLRLMISLAIRTVFRCTRQLENSVLFILDEFGNIGPLPAITSAFTMGAGRQILLWIFIQGLSQLKRDYPHEWEVFIGNADCLTFSNIMDEFTAEYVSKLMGPTTISMTSPAPPKAPLFTGMKISCPSVEDFTGNPNTKYYSRSLLHPSEIRNFPEDLGILIHRGEPIIYEKIKYFSDPLFADLARKDPYYQKK